MVKRILGVDYGDARTGLAYSDAMGLTAVGWCNVKSYNTEKAAEEIAVKAKEIGAELIVIGKPLNMNGTAGPRAEAALAFGETLKKYTDIPITFFDERRTTVQAHEILTQTGVFGKKRKDTVDTLAAEIILQSYMDKQKNIS